MKDISETENPTEKQPSVDLLKSTNALEILKRGVALQELRDVYDDLSYTDEGKQNENFLSFISLNSIKMLDNGVTFEQLKTVFFQNDIEAFRSFTSEQACELLLRKKITSEELIKICTIDWSKEAFEKFLNHQTLDFIANDKKESRNNVSADIVNHNFELHTSAISDKLQKQLDDSDKHQSSKPEEAYNANQQEFFDSAEKERLAIKNKNDLMFLFSTDIMNICETHDTYENKVRLIINLTKEELKKPYLNIEESYFEKHKEEISKFAYQCVDSAMKIGINKNPLTVNFIDTIQDKVISFFEQLLEFFHISSKRIDANKDQISVCSAEPLEYVKQEFKKRMQLQDLINQEKNKLNEDKSSENFQKRITENKGSMLGK